MLKSLFGLGADNVERRGEVISDDSDDSGGIYNRNNIEDILYSRRIPVFLVVHSESCPACKNFIPSWSNLCKNIVKQYPEADNIDEKSTPIVGSIYSERIDNLHDLYVNGVPTTVDELVQYVPTIMRMSPDRKNPKKVDVVKFNKDRTEDNLYEFYKQFKNEMGIMSSLPNDNDNERERERENIKLNISGGGFNKSSKNTKMKKNKNKKNNKKNRLTRKKTRRRNRKKGTKSKRKRKTRRSYK